MKSHGLNINIEALAKGIIEMTERLDSESGESYVTALRFGMLPAPLMNLLDKNLEEKFIKANPHASREIVRGFVDSVSKEVSIAVLRESADIANGTTKG